MKKILFILLFPCAMFGQIDVTGLTIGDSTITRPDAVYWEFATDQIGEGQNIRNIYKADFIQWKNGQKRIVETSGILFLPQYKRYLAERHSNWGSIYQKRNDARLEALEIRNQLLTEYQSLP